MADIDPQDNDLLAGTENALSPSTVSSTSFLLHQPGRSYFSTRGMRGVIKASISFQ